MSAGRRRSDVHASVDLYARAAHAMNRRCRHSVEEPELLLHPVKKYPAHSAKQTHLPGAPETSQTALGRVFLFFRRRASAAASACAWLRLLLPSALRVCFGPLGADFGALLALLVERLFAAQQLDEGLLAAVALAEVGVNDAQIAAFAVAVARRNLSNSLSTASRVIR